VFATPGRADSATLVTRGEPVRGQAIAQRDATKSARK
jgi:hypothetical protein